MNAWINEWPNDWLNIQITMEATREQKWNMKLPLPFQTTPIQFILNIFYFYSTPTFYIFTHLKLFLFTTISHFFYYCYYFNRKHYYFSQVLMSYEEEYKRKRSSNSCSSILVYNENFITKNTCKYAESCAMKFYAKIFLMI